ncbi:ParA family protein [Chondrinema litorale]|uniref:ParA family protein n=1 Tax=Chondrinema litorale TaxID=2994555 RepID=UPI002542821D|nr:ParA family protein [Chondrinema litorale]UZR99008.1 ParA family protein [Chondrinema litorale]
MKVLSIATRKGGAGKSTWTMFCATSLFHILFSKGKKVALIDFDNQKSLTNKRQKELKNPEVLSILADLFDDYENRLKSLFPVYTYTYEEYIEKYDTLNNYFDFVFLDFPGRIETPQKDVLKTIDKVAIPIVADELDIESGMSYMKMCHTLNIKAGWFLNKETNTTYNKDIKQYAHKDYFLNVNPDLVEIKGKEGELLSIRERPEMYRKNRSTVIPFDDKEQNVFHLIKFLINN